MDRLDEIEVVGPLAGLLGLRQHRRRREARSKPEIRIGRIGVALEQVRIGGVLDPDVGLVIAIRGAEIDVETEEVVRLQPQRGGEVVLLVGLAGRVAIRVDLRQRGRRAPVLVGFRVTVAVGDQAVAGQTAEQVRHQRLAGRDAERLARLLRHAQDVVGVAGLGKATWGERRGAVVDGRRDEEVLVVDLPAEVEVAVAAERRAAVGIELIQPAVAVDGVGSGLGTGVQPVVGLLGDDVDDAGDGVGSILRGGTVLQHLDMVDGGGRDHVDVGRGRALFWAGIGRDVRGRVAPDAVEQD